MKREDIQIKFVDIDLCEYNNGQIPGVPENPRTREDKKQRDLQKSIEELPEMTIARAALCFMHDGHYVVIGGNRRLEAQRALQRKEVPIIELPKDTPVEKLRRIALLDNESTGETDWAKVAKEWNVEEIKSWNISTPKGWYNEQQREEVQEDEFEEDTYQIEHRVTFGDIWQLGEHRLMCGDSTDSDAVSKLMNGERADLVFTDPPYGMKKESEGVLNDNLNFDDLLKFNKRWIPLTFANLKDNGSWYCWGIDEPLMDIYSNILRPMQKRNEITFRNLITWDKGNGQGQRSEDFRMYPVADEKCLFVMMGREETTNGYTDGFFEPYSAIRDYLRSEREKSGLSVKQYNAMFSEYTKKEGCTDRSVIEHYFTKAQWMFPTQDVYENILQKTGFFQRPYSELKSEYDVLRAAYEASRPYFDNTHDNMNNVWHFDRTSAEEREGLDHATPKPLALCARGIKTSSREGEIVLDVFGGSGSTMIACEQLGRKCRMMELDPHYCDVIISRWEKLTGGASP